MEELYVNLNRYYFLLQTFEIVLKEVDKSLEGSNQWFIFCHKIGHNFLTQAKTFVFNITQGLKDITIDNISVSERLDISVLYTNIRLKKDTYSTFHHIFIHDGSWEEKILRFNLWKMDALLSRQNFDFKNSNHQNILEEKNEIDRIYNMVINSDYYNELTKTQKEKILRTNRNEQIFANWKFDFNILNNKKDKYTWEELALNTGMNRFVYNDLHNYSSMHAHSNYISVLQHDQLRTNSENYPMRISSIFYSCYLISFFLDDMCKSFAAGGSVIQKLNTADKELIKSFLETGRKKEHIKYFR